MSSYRLTVRMVVLTAAIISKACFLQAQDKFIIPIDETQIKVQKDLEYKTAGTEKLHLDIYQPAGNTIKSAPFIVLMNGFGSATIKNGIEMVEWAKAIAVDGMNAVTYESHGKDVGADFDDVVRFLRENSAVYSFDAARLVVMAFSGHVYYGFPVITDPARKFIKAAVIYYGSGRVMDFRWDMPVLLVRAGRDNPNADRKIDTLIFNAMQHNAPWTVINHHSGTHPFEFDPDGQSTMVIRQTLSFMHNAVSDTLQHSIAQNSDFIIAATSAYTGNYPLAIEKYNRIIAVQPTVSDNYLKLGYVYFSAKDYEQALKAFRKSFDLGEMRKRDLSVPASLSAARLKDAETTLFWLKILVTSPNGKDLVKAEPEYEFVRQTAAYKLLVN